MIWEKRWFQFAILLVLALIWGSSFILMKIGLKSFSSTQAAAIRILSASLALMPYSLKYLKTLKKKDIKSLLIAGFIGSFIPAFLFTKAQTQIDSSLAGMLNTLTPVFTLIIGMSFYKTRFISLQFIGILLGLLGASGLIFYSEDLKLGNINSYGLFVVLATICYGTNINEIKARLTHLSGRQITSLSFMFIGPVALVYLLTTDFKPVFEVKQWPVHLLALAVLGVIGTALAMIIMNTLIRYTSAVFSSSVTYIIPIFAIGWGFLDHEHITLLHILFMSVILIGVYLINRRRD